MKRTALERTKAREDRAQARGLRLDARERARSSRELAKLTRAERRKLLEELRARCKAARVNLRTHQREERARILAELLERHRREREELAARCVEEREAIKAGSLSKLDEARAMRALARSERDRALALELRHKSEAKAHAGRKQAETFAEAMDAGRRQIAAVEPDFEWAWDDFAATPEARRVYREAAAKLRELRRGKTPRPDAVGDRMAERFVEYIDANREELLAELYRRRELEGERAFYEAQAAEAQAAEEAAARAPRRARARARVDLSDVPF